MRAHAYVLNLRGEQCIVIDNLWNIPFYINIISKLHNMKPLSKAHNSVHGRSGDLERIRSYLESHYT